jgi:hypothetical protein
MVSLSDFNLQLFLYLDNLLTCLITKEFFCFLKFALKRHFDSLYLKRLIGDRFLKFFIHDNLMFCDGNQMLFNLIKLIIQLIYKLLILLFLLLQLEVKFLLLLN